MSSSLKEQSVNKMGSAHEKTLAAIQELQKLERELYNNLEELSSDPDNVSEKEAVIARINDLSATRIGLYDTMKEMYNYTQNNVADTRNELTDKILVTKVMESELNNLKADMNAFVDAKQNKLRMVQINTYYGKRYRAHTNAMKLVIKVCALVLVIMFLVKKQIIPTNVGTGLAVIILGVGAFLLFKTIMDLNMRDNLNYDKYDWRKLPQTKPNPNQTKNWGMNTSSWWICGEGTKFNTSLGQCVVASSVSDADTLSGMRSSVVGSLGNIVKSAADDGGKTQALFTNTLGGAAPAPETFTLLGSNNVTGYTSPSNEHYTEV
jgi:hypothetical protein